MGIEYLMNWSWQKKVGGILNFGGRAWQSLDIMSMRRKSWEHDCGGDRDQHWIMQSEIVMFYVASDEWDNGSVPNGKSKMSKIPTVRAGCDKYMMWEHETQYQSENSLEQQWRSKSKQIPLSNVWGEAGK